MINPGSTRHRVVVIGGGYAGTAAANGLRKRSDVDVTLVNPRPEFVQRIRLHQLVADSGRAVADFPDMLAEGVRLLVDRATRIHADARTVELGSGEPLSYDYLVYAVGSTAAVPAGVPGVAEHAYRVAEYDEALRLRAALRDTGPDARVVVIGGGLTAVETAAELADRGRPVTMVCSELHLPSLGDRARLAVVRQLEALGVRLEQGRAVTAVAADEVTLSDGSAIRSDLTIWTAGFGIPDLAARSGLGTDPDGRLLTDETLTSIDDQHIIAAGDASAPTGQPLRMSCQAALPLGMQAARTVLSRITGTQPAAVDQAFLATCVSLGRTRGVLQLTHADDTARAGHLAGRPAALIKELICRSTVAGIRQEARRPGSVPWIRGVRLESSAPVRP